MTPLLARTFERVLLRRLQHGVSLSPEQYGFRAGHSVLEPILEKVLTLFDALSDKSRGYRTKHKLAGLLLSFDFTDAFQRVSADRVVEQYLLLGGNISYAYLLKSFMQERKIQVRFGSAVSQERTMEIGSPQGCVVSPFL